MKLRKKLKEHAQTFLVLNFVLLLLCTTSITKNAAASAEPIVEVVALVEVVSGVMNTYNVGFTFSNKNDCKSRIKQLNMMIYNLVSQGVDLGGKPIQIKCKLAKGINSITLN